MLKLELQINTIWPSCYYCSKTVLCKRWIMRWSKRSNPKRGKKSCIKTRIPDVLGVKPQHLSTNLQWNRLSAVINFSTVLSKPSTTISLTVQTEHDKNHYVWKNTLRTPYLGLQFSALTNTKRLLSTEILSMPITQTRYIPELFA